MVLDGAAMAMIHDKCCRGCGYELNGLGPVGNCPECGGAYDLYSGEGVAGGVMDRHQRGEWVVTLLQTLGLLLGAGFLLVVGALLWWFKGNYTAMIFLGLIAVIFLLSAVATGWSLKRR